MKSRNMVLMNLFAGQQCRHRHREQTWIRAGRRKERVRWMQRVAWKYIYCGCCCWVSSVVSDSLWPYTLWPARLLCPWGFSRQEYWSELKCPTPGDLPNPGTEPTSLTSSALAGRFFTTRAPGKPQHQFSSVQSLSRVRLFVTPWITVCQASLSITNSQSSLKLTSIQSVMPSSHLIPSAPAPNLS